MGRDIGQEQVFCDVAMDGWETMEYFDNLPPELRSRIRSSPFNLCSACVAESPYGNSYSERMEYIEEMEARIRAMADMTNSPRKKTTITF